MTVSEARPVLISLDLARELHLMDRINGMDDRSGIVHLTEAELLASGASRVDWGQPDKHGWYTPTLFSQPEPTPEAHTVTLTVDGQSVYSETLA